MLALTQHRIVWGSTPCFLGLTSQDIIALRTREPAAYLMQVSITGRGITYSQITIEEQSEVMKSSLNGCRLSRPQVRVV